MTGPEGFEAFGKTIVLLSPGLTGKTPVTPSEPVADTLCLMMDREQYALLTDREHFRYKDLAKVFREKEWHLLLSLVFSAKLNEQRHELGLKRPEEDIAGLLEEAGSRGSGIVLADRDLKITLKRLLSLSVFTERLRIYSFFLKTLFARRVSHRLTLEENHDKCAHELLLDHLAALSSAGEGIIHHERLRYIACNIRRAPGERITLVCPEGLHADAQRIIREEAKEEEKDFAQLEAAPEGGYVGMAASAAVVAALIGLIVYKGFTLNPEVTGQVFWFWIGSNWMLTFFAAVAARAHASTVIASAIMSPVTSALPVIGIGMLAVLVQYRYRPPSPMDFISLSADAQTASGFLRNRILHLIVVYSFTSIGSILANLLSIALLMLL